MSYLMQQVTGVPPSSPRMFRRRRIFRNFSFMSIDTRDLPPDVQTYVLSTLYIVGGKNKINRGTIGSALQVRHLQNRSRKRFVCSSATVPQTTKCYYNGWFVGGAHIHPFAYTPSWAFCAGLATAPFVFVVNKCALTTSFFSYLRKETTVVICFVPVPTG